MPFQSDAVTLGVPTWDLSGGLTNRGQQRCWLERAFASLESNTRASVEKEEAEEEEAEEEEEEEEEEGVKLRGQRETNDRHEKKRR